MSRIRRDITCACCGKTGKYGGRGWRTTCYKRWINAGKPKGGPPQPVSPQEAARRSAASKRRSLYSPRLSRMADFEMVRKTRNATIREAAAAVGVTPRTGDRYSAALRQQAGR